MAEKSKAEKRDFEFTPTEQIDFDERNVAIDKLSREIRLGHQTNVMNGFGDGLERVGDFFNDIPTTGDEPAGQELRTADGQSVRVLGKDDSLFESRSGRGEFGGERRPSLSIGKLVRGVACGIWDDAQNEKRALTEGSLTAGGVMLAPVVSGQIIDLARSRMVAIAAGAKTLDMPTSELVLVKNTADPVPSWTAEGETIAESNPTVGKLTLRARKLATYVKLSKELLADAANVSSMIENQLAVSVAQALDSTIFNGDSSPGAEPSGLFVDSGVSEINVGGGPTWVDFLNGIQPVEDANGTPTAMVFSPNTRNSLAQLLVNSEVNNFAKRPESVAKLQEFVSTAMPNDKAIIGDFSQIVLGVRQNVELSMSDSASDGTASAFTADQTWLKIVWRGDIGIIRPSHFTRLIGIV